MNWRKDLFRFWSCSRCAGLFAVSVFLWRWVLASFRSSFSQTHPRHRSKRADHIYLDGKMVKVDRRFLQLSPDKQKETVEEIVNHLNAETAKRYAVYRSSPMLLTVISG
jgi:hypothetical protein